ncbi:MAG: NAD(P)-dependent oxidoreductase [Bacteroidetes bacterium]|nr:NAD(P)-dependent oxidoreductase [Bacteroidota bacterium]MBU1115522.1 NAD(P)-dependent oxidoreductase [Bacteroidota bacterium]MBU1799574.1 NAD(P)-dependent oxidoreductase [Bacteroidota bacterium]
MEKIGFVGLGIMGKPMALNLLKAGFEVIAFNRTKEKVEEIIKAGGKAANTPKEVAESSDIIITMVSDSPDVKDVILGEDGIIFGIIEGSVVIDMSTISPSVTRNIAEKLKEKNVEMLDAPVSGGDVGAINATLSIMVGGNLSTLERCRKVLEAMGKTITHCGTNGMGQTTKLCNQILVSVTNMAVAEAVLFAQKSGLEAHTMVEATKGGAAGSWQLANLGPKMVNEDYAPGFMIDLQQKDLRLVIEAAEEMHLPLPALTYVHQLYKSNQANGEGREGTQALYKSVKRLA